MTVKTECDLKKLELVIAFEPDADLRASLLDWAQEQFGKDVMLQVRVDKSLIAGAEVYFEGKYMDVSLRKDVDKILNTPL